MRLPLLLLPFLLAASALAQSPGNCEPGTAEADLDVSDVRARLFTGGNLFFGNTTTNGRGYLVPKFSGNPAIFAANLWVGGTVDGERRVSGSTFLDFEMWPGPLDDGATLPDPDDCSAYDRIWVIDAIDLQRYETTGETTTDLAEWPVDLGAEVIDGDGIEGNYNLEGGDRPRLFGSQTAFWVMNDVGNEHEWSESAPIGLEVQVTAFAVASPEDALDQATFYRVRLVNRNTLPLEQARFSIWADTDLGDPGDEYEGVDTTRGLGYYYNASETDSYYGIPPAAGFDFLSDGLGSFSYAVNSGFGPVADPRGAVEIDRNQRGLWNDGTPQTASGDGYMTDGPVTVWAFPGDPVEAECWSDVNNCSGGMNVSGNHRIIPTAPPFSLQPGEARTFDVAFLFAQGADHIDSITELRAASDLVQAAYDDGSLFDAVPLVSTLPAPEPVAPAEGELVVGFATLEWEPVVGAEGYTVRWSTDPGFARAQSASTTETQTTVPPVVNEIGTVYWQVRAEAQGDLSPYSAVRSFQSYAYEFDFLGGGDGIVETAYPDADVCPEGNPTGDPGCDEYGGNTVWLDPNATGDYLLTSASDLSGLVAPGIIEDEDFELRFTDACASFGGCLGAYMRADSSIVSVPFELWNIGDADDASDDVRMIPLIRTNDNEPLIDWADAFTATPTIEVDGEELELGVTDRIFFLMPDRPNGYELFEEAANNVGGPGAVYDPETDGDTQIDPNSQDEPCARQGWYVDFCYRDVPPYRAPIGGSGGAGLQVADLADDGTTPPAGTTVRFVTNDRLIPVGAEADGPSVPSSFALEAAYPNPFRTTATVAYRLDAAAEVRLSVYDVLGRRVRVLAEGPTAAGAHRAAFDGAGLTSGVYLVVLEAGGRRQARKVMLVR